MRSTARFFPSAMIEFVVSSHALLEGVRLSRLGSYGNVPFASEEEARAQAKLEARGAPHVVRVEHYPGPFKVKGVLAP